MDGERAMGLIVSCEHASRMVPPGIDLQLSAEQIASHLGWDEGALELACALALGWGAPLLAGTVSRLVVDLGRSPDNPEVVPGRARGERIPGNIGLDDEEREARMRTFHEPYRRALRAEIATRSPCRHLSVRSFAPVLQGRPRRFDVGLRYDPVRRGEVAWVSRLKDAVRRAGFDVRLNQPYLGTDDGMTSWLRRQLPDEAYAGVELEFSQRLTAEQRAALVAALQLTSAAPSPG